MWSEIHDTSPKWTSYCARSEDVNWGSVCTAVDNVRPLTGCADMPNAHRSVLPLSLSLSWLGVVRCMCMCVYVRDYSAVVPSLFRAHCACWPGRFGCCCQGCKRCRRPKKPPPTFAQGQRVRANESKNARMRVLWPRLALPHGGAAAREWCECNSLVCLIRFVTITAHNARREWEVGWWSRLMCDAQVLCTDM